MGGIFSRRRRSEPRQDQNSTATTQASASTKSSSKKKSAGQPRSEKKDAKRAETSASSSSPQPNTTATESKEEPAPFQVAVERADTAEVEHTPDVAKILPVQSDEIELFERQWMDVAESVDGNFSFKMMNFNLLADGLSGARADPASKDKLFLRVPTEFLQWDFRGPRIVEEILRWKPDIVCVEECDKFEFVLEHLQQQGYTGRFKPKEFSPCLRLKNPLPPDGVAIFWQTSVFEQVGEEFTTKQERHRMWTREAIANHIRQISDEKQDELSPFNVNVASDIDLLKTIENLVTEDGQIKFSVLRPLIASKVNDATWEHIVADLDTPTDTDLFDLNVFVEWIRQDCSPCSLSLRLRCVDELAKDQEFFVLATHLVSDKAQNGEYERQRQLVKLLHLDGVRNLMEGAHHFMGCDLNAAPVAIKGYPPLAYRYIVGDSDGNPGEQKIDKFERPLKSAMHNGVASAEIGYTTWKHRAKKGKEEEDKHVIDFLFYRPETWRVTKTLGVPQETDVSQERARLSVERRMENGDLPSALPSKKYPSDHFAICAEFVAVS